MKKATVIFLFIGLMAMIGTVSYAGEPDTPIPKIGKVVTLEKIEAPVFHQDIDIASFDAITDKGSVAYKEDLVIKKKIDAEFTHFYWYIARYKLQDIVFSGYRQRSIPERHYNIIRPPNSYNYVKINKAYQLPRIVPLE